MHPQTPVPMRQQKEPLSLPDRDYMHRREPSVYSPGGDDDEISSGAMLRLVLTWVSVFFLIYKGFVWWEDHKRSLAKPAPLSEISSPAPAVAPSVQSAPPRAVRSQPTPALTPHDGGQWSGGQRTITKCVVNGQTTFTDQDCPHDSLASSVTVNTANVGTVAPRSTTSTKVQVVTTPVAQLPAVAAPSPVADARSWECPALEAHIKQIDAAARQPQSAQTQDRLTEEKRNARSRQFALHC